MIERSGNSLQHLCLNALGQHPDSKAFEFEGRCYTWGQLRTVADKLNGLLDRARVKQQAPVGFMPRNRPSAIGAMVGMLSRGRSIRMIHAFQSPTRAAAEVARLRLSAIVAASEELSPEVMTVAKEQGLAAVALLDSDAEFASGATLCRALEDPNAYKSPTMEILSSGTTGTPKHVPFSYEMIYRDIVNSPAAALASIEAAKGAPGILYFPVSNVSGFCSLLPMILKGKSVVLMDRFTLNGWLDFTRRYKPDIGGLPPAGIRMVLDADVPKEDLSCMKVLYTGAAPLEPLIQAAFEDKYGIPILILYGATEFAGPVAAMTLELHQRYGRSKLGTVGKAAFGASLRIVDPTTFKELAPSQEGILEVIAPRRGTGWFRTSDIGMIDEDGFLFLRGRADGAIVRGGFKLLPETIEKALLLHPAVSFAVVVGLPDDRLGQVPAAAVQLRPGAEVPALAELELHLRDHVLATHVPTRWIIVEQLPRTVSFKVDMERVRRLFTEALESSRA